MPNAVVLPICNMAVEVGFVGYVHSPVPVAVVPSEKIGGCIIVETNVGIYHTSGRIVEVVLVCSTIFLSVELYVSVCTKCSVAVYAVDVNVLFLAVVENLYVAGIDEVNSYYASPGSCYDFMVERTTLIGDNIKDGFRPR